MNDQNSNDTSEVSKSYAAAGKVTRRRTWVLIAILILVVLAGCELISNWENFSRGLSGKPEHTK